MTTRKKAIAVEPVKPSTVKVINVSGRGETNAPDTGFFAFDCDEAFVYTDHFGNPFETEQDALDYVKNGEWEPPYYIAKYTLVARCV
jgi:hypothetical protein